MSIRIEITETIKYFFVIQVRSFSQLRNEFADVETFYLGTAMVAPALSPGISAPLPIESPIRR